MATLQYTSWFSAAEVAHGQPIQENVITVTNTSTQGEALSAPTGGEARHRLRVRIMSDTNCWVTWGSDPTALATGLGGRMVGSGNPEYFDIEAGFKIAVIERT